MLISVWCLNVVEEVECVVGYYELLVEDEGVMVKVDGYVWVDVDLMLYQCVLSNLLLNVLIYVLCGSVVMIDCVEQGGVMMIVVLDMGFGIVVEYVGWIFECFYCVDLLWYNLVLGMGFGFVIVWLIMDNYGGECGVDSELGCCMIFWLCFLCWLVEL